MDEDFRMMMIWVVMEELSSINKRKLDFRTQRLSNLLVRKTRAVSHYGLAIYMKKYLKAKDKLWELKYFTMQKHNLQKSSKRNQNPSRYYKGYKLEL